MRIAVQDTLYWSTIKVRLVVGCIATGAACWMRRKQSLGWYSIFTQLHLWFLHGRHRMTAFFKQWLIETEANPTAAI